MTFSFSKYQGTGNDFIMVNCTDVADFKLSSTQIEKLCDRRMGIGADGIILIFKHPQCHFKMVYYNSDGTQSFCGNGARCATQFAHSLGLFVETAIFEAIDGIHTATKRNEQIFLEMNDVPHLEKEDDAYIIDTGSPHYIKFVEALHTNDIVTYGRTIRYAPKYKEQGINVNLVKILAKNKLKMLTYERGVEDETYSCGTGATAVALAYADMENQKEIAVQIEVKGGQLEVKGERKSTGFTSIYLIGPAKMTFEGDVSI